MLHLKKNGLLYNTKWVYDKETGEGEYKEFDVTATPQIYLFNECELDSDITLRDLFLFIQRHIDFFDLIVTNWCREIVEEGLSPVETSQEKDMEIEYLEVYKLFTVEEGETDGMTRANFHGIGYVNEENDRTHWGVSLSSAKDLIDLPLRLNTTCDVFRNYELLPYVSFPNIAYTLVEIIYGIIWELSFFGGPQERQEKKEELDAMMDEIEQED
jgi:hypothetical protein